MHEFNPQPVRPAAPGGGERSASIRTTPHMVSRVCSGIIKWTLLTLTFLVPLFFLPWTVETSELNKQLLVFIGAAVAGLAWIGKMLAERKFEYRRTIVNVIVVLFLAVYGISTWLSHNVYLSSMGDFGQEQAGFFTVLSFVVLFLVAVNNIQSEKMIKWMFGSLVLSGFLVTLLGILQGLGLFALPFAFTKTSSFNTVGTAASLGIFSAFTVMLCGGILLYGHGQDKLTKREIAMKVFVAVTAIMGIFVVAVLDFWPVTLCLLLSSAVLIAFAFVHAKSMRGLGGILLPTAAFIVALLLLFFRFPLALNFPAEVMPSGKATRSIVMQSLRVDPFFGSGPGTFIYDYAKYRSAEVNGTAFWNIRFDRGSNHFMTLLPTVGLLGTLSWLLVSLFLLVSAGRKLLKSDERTWHILIGMFSAWLLLLLSKFLYSSTLTLEFMFWISMALLVVVHKHDFYSVRFERSPRAAMVLSFVFILGLVFTLSGLFVVGQRYAGEIAYAKAIQLDRGGAKSDEVIGKLTSAVNLNQNNDVYLRNLALALIVKADELLNEPMGLTQNEGESDADFNLRRQSEAQNRVRAASNLTAQAVNVARNATEINPSNVANWSVLATVYQNLIGVTDGADEWAKTSYESALEREPNNPQLHTELGKILMTQAAIASQDLQTEDEEAKAAAQAKVDELLGNAVDSFNKAIELKGDYAPAHFNLGLALDRQGKLDEAIVKMENVVRLNPRDVGVGFQLALLYYRNDRKDEAVRLMESVLQLSPNYANARWYLAAMYEERGEKDKAIAQLERVLEVNPDNELVSRKLNELKGVSAAPPAEGEAPPEGEGEDLPEPVDVPVENANQPEVGQ